MTHNEAERAIAGILAELERDTGGYVMGVEVIDIETTTHTDDRPKISRRVHVKLKPKPSGDWVK